MKRITTDNVNEMGMFGLAHNCCYIGKDGSARYRDFDIDIDARELAKGLLKELAKQDIDFESDVDFDEWLGACYGEDGIGTIHGLIAMFYQNIWSMAELRENLKRYEDLEEQERLVVLPCKVGDTVYCIYSRYTKCSSHNWEFDEFSCQGCESECDSKREYYINEQEVYSLDWIVTLTVNKHFGKTIFFTREEAEAALEKMGGVEK